MAAKKASTQKPGQSTGKPTIADVIASRVHSRVELTSEQLQEVKAALKHNDATTSFQHRLSLAVVRKHLRDHYGFQGSERALELAVIEAFKRKSWITP